MTVLQTTRQQAINCSLRGEPIPPDLFEQLSPTQVDSLIEELGRLWVMTRYGYATILTPMLITSYGD